MSREADKTDCRAGAVNPAGRGRERNVGDLSLRGLMACEEGSALIEAAFVFPILIVLMLGVLQVAIYASLSTLNVSAATVGSQMLAASRGSTGAAAAVAGPVVTSIKSGAVWNVPASSITVRLFVDSTTACSTCTGSGSTAPYTATCTGSCDTALSNAAPDQANGTYKMSSVSVQTNCAGITFLNWIPLTCPITSQVYGVVQ
jgi:Flp pilus assembly protein TadG